MNLVIWRTNCSLDVAMHISPAVNNLLEICSGNLLVVKSNKIMRYGIIAGFADLYLLRDTGAREAPVFRVPASIIVQAATAPRCHME
jgi:hypothetical protein